MKKMSLVPAPRCFGYWQSPVHSCCVDMVLTCNNIFEMVNNVLFKVEVEIYELILFHLFPAFLKNFIRTISRTSLLIFLKAKKFAFHPAKNDPETTYFKLDEQENSHDGWSVLPRLAGGAWLLVLLVRLVKTRLCPWGVLDGRRVIHRARC